ncbi:MAG: S8 family serine peptidase [Bacteroidales bacterium]|nr:S8 family serine peptidase [Bacteroidales bacterium]
MKLDTVTRNFAKYLITAVMAVACTVKETDQTQAPTESEPVVSVSSFHNQAVVEFDDDWTALVESGAATKAPGLEQLMQDLGIASMERVFPDAGEFEARSREMGMHRFYTVTYKDDIPSTKAVDALGALPGVLSVDPVRPIRKRAIFNDPKLSSQWHYINSKYSGADINVENVWKNYTVGDSKVIVCVVDEPVDPTHPDLQANLWNDGSGHTGYNFARSSYDLSIRPENGNGDVGHGTHVAGTISAVNNNGVGLCGVAGGDYANGKTGVLLQSCAIFSGSKSASDAATANAIKWGADHGAVISQNSWGYYADANGDGTVSSSELTSFKQEKIANSLKAAIDYFIKNAGCDAQGNQAEGSPMKGGLVIFAAGNENINYDPICAYEPVIAVGAFRETGKKASYSNYGTWVDIAAPGGEGSTSTNSVWSTLPTKIADGYGGIETTDGYGGLYWAGTSMACPHVSGVAALIISYYGEEGFTNDRAKEILFGGLGDTIGGSSPIGQKLDALASFEFGGVKGGDPLSLPVKELTLHAHEEKTLRLTVKASDGATVECTPGSSALVYTPEDNNVKITGRNAQPGTYTAVFVLKQSGEEDYTLEFTYTILPNHAPYVSLGSYKFDDIMLSSLGLTYSKTKPTSLAALFVDEDGEILDISVTNSDSGVIDVKDDGDRFSIKSVGYGLAKVSITAKDSFDKMAEISFNVAVKNPDKSSSTEAVPEVATDKVSLWPVNEKAKSFIVSIYSSAGAKVMTAVADGGLFQTIDVDITSLAPGVYTAELVSGTFKDKVKFVKI